MEVFSQNGHNFFEALTYLTNKQQLENQLTFFNNLGYSIDNEDGLFCLAAPIFGADNKLQAAISVAGPKERMVKQKDFIVEKLTDTAKKVASSIGYGIA
ncbi:MAG: IclR family transcriptional regulator C-terminal domain-containing protein [Bacillus sp. (in: firmicutes)]